MISINTKEQDPEKSAEEFVALVEAAANKTVNKHLGVQKGYLNEFLSEVSTEATRLSIARDSILNREFRKDLDRLVTTITAIVRQCRQDPNDINEELALASIVREIADSVDEYGKEISRPHRRPHHEGILRAVEKDIRETRLPWARKLLERMSLNDLMPAAERLGLSTTFFKS